MNLPFPIDFLHLPRREWRTTVFTCMFWRFCPVLWGEVFGCPLNKSWRRVNIESGAGRNMEGAGELSRDWTPGSVGLLADQSVPFVASWAMSMRRDGNIGCRVSESLRCPLGDAGEEHVMSHPTTSNTVPPLTWKKDNWAIGIKKERMRRAYKIQCT